MTTDGDGRGAANDNPGPPTPPADELTIVEVSDGNVTQVDIDRNDGTFTAEPLAGEDHSPPENPSNDNPEPPDAAS